MRAASGSLDLDTFTPGEESGEMVFRLIMSEAPDLTTIGIVGRLGDDAVVILGETCSGARRPLVLDLSDLRSASDAGVLLLRRLAGEGVHLLGASRYVRLLLEQALDPGAPASRRRSGSPPPQAGRRRQRHRP